MNIDKNHKQLESKYDDFVKHYHDLAKQDIDEMCKQKSPSDLDQPRSLSINQYRALFYD